MINLKLLKVARFFHLINKKNYNEKRQIEIVTSSSLFDAKWYLTQNPDVKAKKIGAAKHYVKYGWKEGRNPSQNFDTEEYLAEYPELKVKNWCPLFHYMLEHKKITSNIDYKEQIFNLFDKYTNKYKEKLEALERKLKGSNTEQLLGDYATKYPEVVERAIQYQLSEGEQGGVESEEEIQIGTFE